MKKYVKAKRIYLYDFLMFTGIETYVVVYDDRKPLCEGQSGIILSEYNVGGYIIDTITTGKNGNIYLEVHEE